MDWKGLLAEANQVSAHEEKFGGSGTMHTLRGSDLAAALRQCEADTIRRCADLCDQQAQEFLSPEYAANQPLSSVAERFACREVKRAILALLPKETGQ